MASPSFNNAINKMGIQATVQNVNGFIASVTKINKVIASQGAAITAVQAKFQTAAARIAAADARRIASNNKVLSDIVKLAQQEIKSDADVLKAKNKHLSDLANARAKVKVQDSKTVADQAKSNAKIIDSQNKLASVQQKNATLVQATQLKADAVTQAAQLKHDAVIKASNDKLTIAQLRAQTALQLAQMRSASVAQSSSNIMSGSYSAVNNVIDRLSGRFKVLSGAAGGIGTAIGTAIGGPGGGAIGGGIGNVLGGLAGAAINIPLKVVGTLGRGVLSIFGKIIDGIKGIGGAINNLLFGPLSLFGLMLGATFKNLLDGITQTAGAVWDAAEAFQKLTISIQTLTAREIARQRQTAITQDIMDAAKGATQELFDWMTKVSLTSPFTMQTIAGALKFSSAMGLSIKTTKDLVLATGNFAAAMGLEEDHQERIMYNLAQIYQQGKLTGREFRDLAISFVPVYDILREMAAEAGMETEAFKKLALEGGVPVEEFFDHFIGYMNKNFPDAMKNMSRTMEGVRNNIKDFIQVVLGLEVLKPVMDRISGGLADVLDKLMAPSTHQIARDFGQGLVQAFDNIRIGVNQVGDAVTNFLKILGFVKPTVEGIEIALVKLYLNGRYSLEFLASAINTVADAVKNYVIPTLQQVGLFSRNGEGYGQSFIYNFAHGIIVGVAKFLAKAIIFVTAFIRAFFKANSPPKVAPEIDKWGGAMMDSWITGMITETDWGKLKDVGKVAQEQFATAIPDQTITRPQPTGNEADSLERPGRIIPGYKPVVGSLKDSVGKAVASVRQFVTESGIRMAADFMRGFSSGMFDALDAIQSPLKETISALTGLGQIGEVQGIEMFYNFSQDLIRSLDEFNKTGVISQKLLDNISQLGMGLGPELSELVKRQFQLAGAVKAAAEAQERLNNANKAYASAQNAVRAMIREYNQLLRAGAGKSTLKTKLQEVNASERTMANAAQEVSLAEANKKAADENVERLKEQAELQDKLLSNLLEMINLQKEASDAAKGGAGDLANAMDDLAQQIEEISTGGLLAGVDWKKWEDEFGPGIQDMWKGLAKDFADAFNETMGNTDTQNAANNLMTSFKNSISNILGMPANFEVVQEGVADSLTKGTKNVQPTGGKSYFQRVVDWIFGGHVDWTAAIGRVTDALITIVGTALDKLIARITNPDDPLHKIVVDGAVKLATSFVGQFWKSVGEIIWNKLEGDNPVLNFPKDIDVTPGFTGLNDVTPKEVTREDMQQWAKDTFEFDIGVSPTINITPAINPFEQGQKSGEDYTGGVTTGMGDETSLKSIGEAVSGFFTNLWNSLTSIFISGSPAMALVPIGNDIVAGIMKGISDFVALIVGPGGSISVEVNKIIDAFLGFFGIKRGATTTGKDSVFYSIGSAIVQGVIDGINSMEGALQAAWEWVVGLLPDWAQKLLNISSPSKVMMDIGENVTLGFIEGIKKSSKAIAGTLKAYLTPDIIAMKYQNAKATYAPSRMVTATSSVNVTFGDVHIGNDMDWATFKAKVQRAVVER